MQNTTATPIDTDLLMAQNGWLRSLARNLVRDPAGAEDIAQETMLAALQAPPRDAADAARLRAWLGRVAFNLSNLNVRRNMRRRAREEDVAREDFQSSAADTVFRESIVRLVLNAVRSLDEPYRTTVRERYFEGHSTATIAARMGTTDNAVRKRLWRARQKLRDALDREHAGDRSAWFNALLPFAGWKAVPADATTATAGASGGTAGLKLFVGAAALALTAGSLAVGLSGGRAVSAAETPALAGLAPRSVSSVLEAGAPGQRRSADPWHALGIEGVEGERRACDAPPNLDTERDAADAGETSEPAASVLVSGRVLDPSGAPVAHAAIGVAEDGSPPRTPLGWSDGSGRFALELVPPVEIALIADDRNGSQDLATLRRARVEAWSADAEHVVIAAPSVGIAGVVLDAADRPVADARLEIGCDETAYLDLGVHLSSVLRPSNALRRGTNDSATDADGRFELGRVASWPGVWLEASHPDHAPVRVALPLHDEGRLVLRLGDEGLVPTRFVSGIVSLEDGSPAVDAEVRLAHRSTHTDETGFFRLRADQLPSDTPLFAEKDGMRPLYVPRMTAFLETRDGGTRSEWTLHTGPLPRIVLAEAAASIRGRVVDAFGAPCAGWIAYADQLPPENAAGEAGHARSGEVLTDGDGEFELEGLVAARHSVRVFDPHTLASTDAIVVDAKDEEPLLLSLAADVLRERVEGQVVGPDGAPVPMALVAVSLPLGGSAGEAWRVHGQEVLTDSLGRFALEDVPRRLAEFEVRAGTLPPAYLRLDADAPDAGHRFPLPRWVAFRVELSTLEGDSFALLDRGGHEAALAGLARHDGTRGQLHGGRSLVHLAREAETLVVFDDGVEVGRIDLAAENGVATSGTVRVAR